MTGMIGGQLDSNELSLDIGQEIDDSDIVAMYKTNVQRVDRIWKANKHHDIRFLCEDVPL